MVSIQNRKYECIYFGHDQGLNQVTVNSITQPRPVGFYFKPIMPFVMDGMRQFHSVGQVLYCTKLR